jgi:short-subunit dehydrogenase
MFNIAGSFMAGEIRDSPLENWHAMTQANVATVMNGTHYAYQIMLRQGSGHIINMASTAGLIPIPGMGIYGATKFAVVGLTHALRIEAKDLGIKASVVCPTLVNTPLYDKAIYNTVDKTKALKYRNTVQNPQTAARQIIKGVYKNKATIHTSMLTTIGWWFYRLSPGLYSIFALRSLRIFRRTLRK